MAGLMDEKEHSRLHEPGKFHRFVLDQDHIWIDINGHEHRLLDMSREYKLNVLLFLYENHRYKFDPFKSKLIRRLREDLLEGEVV